MKSGERTCGSKADPGFRSTQPGLRATNELAPTETKRRTRNAGRCIRYDHATRTNVAIRPRFRAWRGPRRGPLTSRRSATALTAANQRRRSAPDALPGTRLKDGCCPSPPVPVQRQSRRPVMMPAGRIPGAARGRNVSSRPREPHSPHRRKHPRSDVLPGEMIRKIVSENGIICKHEVAPCATTLLARSDAFLTRGIARPERPRFVRP